jgi:hypothetical protein
MSGPATGPSEPRLQSQAELIIETASAQRLPTMAP